MWEIRFARDNIQDLLTEQSCTLIDIDIDYIPISLTEPVIYKLKTRKKRFICFLTSQTNGLASAHWFDC